MPVFSWINVALGAVAAFALSWLLHTVDIERIEKKQEAALSAQAVKLNADCEADKKVTKEANDGLQKQLGIIAGKLAASKRLHSSLCVIPLAGRPDAGGSGTGHAGQNGISAEWLGDYAAECETYRQQRLTLEKFITDTWAAEKAK